MEGIDYVAGLDEKLVSEIENYSWTDGKYRYDFPIRIEVFFETGSREGNYFKFTASLMTATRSGIQLRDKRWDFYIDQSRPPKFGGMYHPFSGLIEYNILICLGFEGDRIKPLAGHEYFDKARLISDKARFDNRYSRGWDIREEFILDVLRDKQLLTLREARFNFQAASHYVLRNALDKARPYLLKSVNMAMSSDPDWLELRRDAHIISFMDKSTMIEYLKMLEEVEILHELAAWDDENEDLYR